MAILRSLLDTDFYKVTMAQAVRNRWPDVRVRYRFKNRTAGVDLRPIRDEIKREIADLGRLAFSEEELAYLRAIPFLSPSFVDSLRRLRLDPACVTLSERDGGLDIGVEGGWFETIWFEVPVLAIVNELWFRHFPDAREEGRRRLAAKIARFREFAAPCADDVCAFRIMEFGTRRRYSREWQEEVVATLAREVPEILQGTSNVDLARRYGLRPQGTMAHEWLQAHQALAPLPLFQRVALDAWLQEFRGSLGVALSDVVGFDAFLRDFDLLLAKSFEGARHDSGDPFVWGEKLIAHYRALGLDPATKLAVFSDGLDPDLCLRLFERFRREIKMIFGIGTNLTNDMGYEPLAIVMKMVECEGFPVAKLSDSPGKGMCEMPEFEALLRRWFGGANLGAPRRW